jgi:hypothetical protein
VVYVANGSRHAVATLDLETPEFPVEVTRLRRGVRTPFESGISYGRQTGLSVSETSYKAERRTWSLHWRLADQYERSRIRDLYLATQGSGGLLLYLPPEIDASIGGSNLAPTPERLTSFEWQPGTSDTSTSEDATAVPTGTGGTATLLTNASGATTQAKIVADVTRFPSAGTAYIFSCWVRRPASNPGTRFTLRVFNPNNGNEHYITWGWGGSSWTATAASSNGGQFDGLQGVDDSQDPWFRLAYGSTAGTFGAASTSAWPGRRVLSIENGTAGTPSPNTSLIVHGAMLEEARSFADTSSFGGVVAVPGGLGFTLADYSSQRRHVYVRFAEPLRITRTSPNAWEMRAVVEEVPFAAG